jgi:molybdopterin/thiamine biosynthesis adenylyltransferase
LPTIIDQARLDRQLRIPDWNQEALARARVGVVGDSDLLTPLFLLAAAALGLNQVLVAAPRLDHRFVSLARQLNPDWQLSHFAGYYSHPLCQDIFRGCHLVVDLSRSGLVDKILLEQAFQHRLTVLRGFNWQADQEQGFKIFTYLPGREWLELQEMLFPVNLPGRPGSTDGVLDIIAAGLILEETKNILLGGPVSPEVISYRSPRWDPPSRQPTIGVVGAGALGNFVGLGLALAGFTRMTFMDPDVIELTNLNRQVFFAGAVGEGKAETLAARLNQGFGTQAAAVRDYFREDSEITGFDVVFDCVDNFASRIVLSRACAAAGKILVSGGTHVAAGQVVAYHPAIQPQTPSALLGLDDIIARRPPVGRERAACVYQPDPAVIMTNQIIGGFMVEAGRQILAGVPAPPLFYDASVPQRFSLAGED